ncbi:MAG: helix-turn-helix domain-containing protein [Nannocystales bacterium]
MNAYATALIEYQPRPIGSAAQHTAALKSFEELQAAYGAAPSRHLGDLMEVCAMLIESYEETTHPAPDVSPGDLIRHLMDEAGVSQADLARGLETSPGQVSNMLNGKRNISTEMAVRLGRRFGVSSSLFLELGD